MDQSTLPRRPYIFALALFASACLVWIAADSITRRMLHLPGWLPGALVFNIALALTAVILLNRFGCWRLAGFRSPGRPGQLWLFVPAAILLPADFVMIATVAGGCSGLELATLLFAALASSFAAEAVYRGLILRAVAPLGVWRAAAFSALLFAAFHAVYVLAGADIHFVLVRTIPQAFALGFCWAALALRTSTLWPLLFIHFVMDFTGFFGRDRKLDSLLPTGYNLSSVDYIGATLFFVVFFSYGALLLVRGAIEAAQAATPPSHPAKTV